MKITFFVFIFLFSFINNAFCNDNHLFILSGQSNMAYLDPKGIFIPTVGMYYGDRNIIVVHDAEPAKSIVNWAEDAWLWERLVENVKLATSGKRVVTVTFIWMQGESDYRYSFLYEDRLNNLLFRVKNLFPFAESFFVIGRITDYTPKDNIEGWEEIRKIQENICNENENFLMINTDDLNGEDNGVHFDDNYDELAKRFADAAIKMNPRKVNLLFRVVQNIVALKVIELRKN